MHFIMFLRGDICSCTIQLLEYICYYSDSVVSDQKSFLYIILLFLRGGKTGYSNGIKNLNK